MAILVAWVASGIAVAALVMLTLVWRRACAQQARDVESIDCARAAQWLALARFASHVDGLDDAHPDTTPVDPAAWPGECLRPTLFALYSLYPRVAWQRLPFRADPIECEHPALLVVDNLYKHCITAAEFGEEVALRGVPQWIAVCRRCAKLCYSNDPALPQDIWLRAEDDVTRQRVEDPGNDVYKVLALHSWARSDEPDCPAEKENEPPRD